MVYSKKSGKSEGLASVLLIAKGSGPDNKSCPHLLYTSDKGTFVNSGYEPEKEDISNVLFPNPGEQKALSPEFRVSRVFCGSG